MPRLHLKYLCVQGPGRLQVSLLMQRLGPDERLLQLRGLWRIPRLWRHGQMLAQLLAPPLPPALALVQATARVDAARREG